MRDLGRRLRRHLSYATVVSSITAFVLLAGGAAFAANQLAKNSVGKKQLKANAVTTAKIKKNAVTAAKIKAGAVDGSKVKDGSLGAGNLNLADMPFSRIVHQARGSATVDVGTTYVVYPLSDAGYTQPPGEDDFFGATLDVTYPLASRLSLGMSYWYEQYRVEDFTLDIDANPDLARLDELLSANHA